MRRLFQQTSAKLVASILLMLWSQYPEPAECRTKAPFDRDAVPVLHDRIFDGWINEHELAMVSFYIPGLFPDLLGCVMRLSYGWSDRQLKLQEFRHSVPQSCFGTAVYGSADCICQSGRDD